MVAVSHLRRSMRVLIVLALSLQDRFGVSTVNPCLPQTLCTVFSIEIPASYCRPASSALERIERKNRHVPDMRGHMIMPRTGGGIQVCIPGS